MKHQLTASRRGVHLLLQRTKANTHVVLQPPVQPRSDETRNDPDDPVSTPPTCRRHEDSPMPRPTQAVSPSRRWLRRCIPARSQPLSAHLSVGLIPGRVLRPWHSPPTRPTPIHPFAKLIISTALRDLDFATSYATDFLQFQDHLTPTRPPSRKRSFLPRRHDFQYPTPYAKMSRAWVLPDDGCCPKLESEVTML